MKWWPWFPKQAPTYTSDSAGRSPGCCAVCGDDGVVCLNGQSFFCWDHYRDEMLRLQPRREALAAPKLFSEAPPPVPVQEAML